MDSQMLWVYYDGLCPICSREMNYFRRIAPPDFKFVDITSSSFDARKSGLDPLRIQKVMHVKTADGRIRTGVDAFIAIWERVPQFHWLARLAKISFVRAIMNVGYNSFAFIRPYLPRKDCADGVCS